MANIHSLIYSLSTASTNDDVRKYSENTIFVAGSQSKGRGRRGRSWISPYGGLYFSYKFINKGLLDDSALSIVAGIAVVDVLAEYSSGFPFLKWPNDLVDSKGKKLAGILIEKNLSEDTLVLGVGINLDSQDIPTDIATFVNCSLPNQLIALKIIESFNRLLELEWRDIEKKYWQFAALAEGQSVEIHYPDGSVGVSSIIGLSNYGELIVNEKGKERKLTSAVSIRPL